MHNAENVNTVTIKPLSPHRRFNRVVHLVVSDVLAAVRRKKERINKD